MRSTARVVSDVDRTDPVPPPAKPGATARELQRVQAALQESEALHEAILDTALSGIVTIDVRGIVQSFNRAAERMFGYRAAEVIGKNVRMLMPEPYAGEHDGYLQHYVATGERRIIGVGREVEAMRKDGSVFPVDLAVSEVRVGNVLRFTGLITDITLRKAQQAALRTRAEQQRVVAELGRDALAGGDLDALLRGVCERVAATLDVEFCKVLEVTPEGDAFVLRAGHGWQHEHDMRVPLDAATQAGYTFRLGQPVVVEHFPSETRFSGAALLGDHGVVSGMSVLIGEVERPWGLLSAHAKHRVTFTADDVAFLQSVANVLAAAIARHHAEQELRQHRDHLDELVARRTAELERSNEELSDFAYIASHDLKEPLRGIANYASFLLEDYGAKLDAEGQRMLRKLGELCQRLDTLIDSLLQFSRAGRVELAWADTDLDAVARDILESLQVTIEQEHVEIVVPRPLPTVRCDSVRVGEIFRNLITNAIRYNDRADKRVEIGYRESLAVGPVFYVADNGIGIPTKHRDGVFGMFKRLHGRDKYGGGTGAGLSITRKIVERHGGKIWIDASGPEGTTFAFTLTDEPVAKERET